jgi:ferredoxin
MPSCIDACLYSVIQMDDYPAIDPQGCVGCAHCIRTCPTGAMHRPEGWYEQYTTARAGRSGKGDPQALRG